MDLPWLNCSECQSLNEDDPEIFPYPCDMCPNKLLAHVGEVGLKAVEVYQLLASNPMSEVMPSWELLFEMAGITRPSLKRAVYERVCLKLRLEQEHQKAEDTKAERTFTNPHA